VYKENDDVSEPRPFRMCERCGQPTPSNLPQCVNCGAVSAHAVVADEESRAERRFQDALFSRATPATFALLIINVAVFVLMMVSSGNSEEPSTLIAFGAKTNELLRRGEWFRLVTPIFIHAGWAHLLFNSYALWVVGTQVEKLYGSARFLLIYLLAGVGGVAGSYFGQAVFRKAVDAPSVGASGAIFGLFGVMAVFGFRYRHELPPTIRRVLGAGVLPVIVINLFIGFSFPFIDNAAHIGGLLTGAALTLLIPYIAPGRERVSKLGLLIIALCAAVIIYCFAQAHRTSGKYFAQGRAQIAAESFLNGVTPAQTALNRAFNASLNRSSGQELSSAKSDLGDAIEKLRNAQAPDAKSEQIRQELLHIAGKQLSSMTAPPDAGAANKAAIKANLDDYDKFLNRLKEWAVTEGPKYGMSWREEERPSK
jgi:membrane associated rhomboid family serine protease